MQFLHVGWPNNKQQRVMWSPGGWLGSLRIMVSRNLFAIEVPTVNMATRAARCGAWAVACLLLASVPAAANEADDQYRVAAGQYARGRWELAWQEFDAFLASFADHPQAAEARFYRAEAAMQLSRYQSSRDDYRSYLDLHAEGQHAQQARFRVAEASYLLGDRDQATRDLQQFLDKHPADPLAAYALPYLAEMELAAGKTEQAADRYQQALDRFPTGPLADDCRLGLARALEIQQQWEEASLYLRALAAKQGSPLSAKAQFHLGLGEYRQGRIDVARTEFEQLAVRHPQGIWHARAKLALARCDYRQSRWPAAERRLRPLLDQPEVALEAALWLGLTQKAQSQWQAAQTTLTQAASDAANGPQSQGLLRAAVVFHAADAARMAGNLDTAKQWYGRVLQEWPTSRLAEDALLGQLLTALAAEDHSRVDRWGQEISLRLPSGRQREHADRAWARSLLSRRKYSEAVVVLLPLVNQVVPATAPAALVGGGASETLLGVYSAPLDARGGWPDNLLASHVEEVSGQPGRQRTEDLYLLALAYQGLQRYHEALVVTDQILPAAADALLADTHLTRAAILLALDRDQQSIPHLEHYRLNHPLGDRRRHCLEELAVVYARLGALPRARSTYDELRDESPAQYLAPAACRVAQTLQSRGEHEWSGELFEELLSLKPTDEVGATALLGLARSYTARRQHAKAAETWRHLLNQYPTHTAAGEAALTRARFLADQQAWAEAAALYAQVIDGALPSSPEQLAVAMWGAGQAADRQGNREEALRLYGQLDRQFANLSFRDALLYQWAWTHRDLQQSAQAEGLLKRLVEEHSESTYWHDAAFRLAEAHFDRGELEASGELIARVLHAQPPEDIAPHALFLSGRLAIAAKDWAASEKVMQRVVREHPHSSLAKIAVYWEAESAYQQNHFEHAQQRFAQLPESLATTHRDLAAMSALRQSQCLAAMQEWRTAKEKAEAALEKFPDFAQRYELDYVRGRCLAAKALFIEAREAYRSVTSSQTGGKTETAAMAQWMIGETYFHQQDYQAAIREYLRVEILYAYPLWQSAALLQAGKCHERLGQYGQAAELFARLVQDFPDSPHAADAAKRLPLAKQRSTNNK